MTPTGGGDDNRNYFIALGLMFAIFTLWQVFVGGPALEKRKAEEAAKVDAEAARTPAQSMEAGSSTSTLPTPSALPAPDGSVRSTIPDTVLPRADALGLSPRVPIESSAIEGSIALKGARIDDVRLKRYRETIDEASPIITFLSPARGELAYYGEFGWIAAQGGPSALPGAETLWTQVGSGELGPGRPITLQWANGAGLVFERTISLDENYMFTIRQSVRNDGASPVTLYPYGLVSRQGLPPTQDFWIQHEGPVGVFQSRLKDVDYGDLKDDGTVRETSTGGWLGITDKYWMTALVPHQGEEFKGRFMTVPRGVEDVFQADYLLNPRTVAPGASAEVTNHFFAGAKKVRLINAYEKDLGIDQFGLAIDWGWFGPLTKGFFWGLSFFAGIFGNFGVAILLVTVVVKIIFFPFANMSYVAMSKMKKVQPELLKIRDRFKDDKQRQQQEMMELYKREKVNPVSGCLPVLLQIPVFFALYKVLFISLEMRHAPFFGWIQDLSAPDPTSIFNLFGLLPYDPTAVPLIGSMLGLGIWPIFMGLTMWLQMRMNPPPPDPVQQKIFAFMPLIFTFVLAGFSAGLVIYWAWNNFLSIIQQYAIMRRMGVDVDLIDNLKLPDWAQSTLKSTPIGSHWDEARERKAAESLAAEAESAERAPGKDAAEPSGRAGE